MYKKGFFEIMQSLKFKETVSHCVWLHLHSAVLVLHSLANLLQLLLLGTDSEIRLHCMIADDSVSCYI